MTAWTLLLEALHSAFISALKEQGANPTLELGMPQRLPGFKFPEPLALPAQFLITEVEIPPNSAGFTGLLFQSEKPPITEIWKTLHRHTGLQFAQKNIRPILMTPKTMAWSERGLRPEEIFKKRIQMPTRTLWIPVRWGKTREELALFLAV